MFYTTSFLPFYKIPLVFTIDIQRMPKINLYFIFYVDISSTVYISMHFIIT